MKLNNVYLIGPMGAGKSTVGTQLAKKLGFQFYDTDRTIEERTGVDLSWIFSIEGEIGFHKREQDIIEELSGLNKIVLSTGGGSICEEKNRRNLSSNGFVIYLMTSMPEQFTRTSRNRKNRPQLQVDNLEAEIHRLMEERKPLYEEIADFSLSTDGKSVRAVVNEIMQALG